MFHESYNSILYNQHFEDISLDKFDLFCGKQVLYQKMRQQRDDQLDRRFENRTHSKLELFTLVNGEAKFEKVMVCKLGLMVLATKVNG